MEVNRVHMANQLTKGIEHKRDGIDNTSHGEFKGECEHKLIIREHIQKINMSKRSIKTTTRIKTTAGATISFMRGTSMRVKPRSKTTTRGKRRA